jgi:RNA 2',3'-cyclic 3'-phosphodiesterase
MADDERARLFVALDLPEPARLALIDWRAPLLTREPQLLRAVAPAALHVTLCFLGQQPLGAGDAIGAAVVRAAAAAEVRALRLGEARWLPRRAPRVLAVAIGDRDGELGRLHGALSGALADGGWHEPEERPYLPHATVARVRARGNERAARELGRDPLPLVPAIGFDGAAVTLYRSWLGDAGGARYEPLTRVELR